MSDLDDRKPFPPGVGDPYGREVEDIRRDARLATRAVELLDEALAVSRQLTLGCGAALLLNYGAAVIPD